MREVDRGDLVAGRAPAVPDLHMPHGDPVVGPPGKALAGAVGVGPRRGGRCRRSSAEPGTVRYAADGRAAACTSTPAPRPRAFTRPHRQASRLAVRCGSTPYVHARPVRAWPVRRRGDRSRYTVTRGVLRRDGSAPGNLRNLVHTARLDAGCAPTPTRQARHLRRRSLSRPKPGPRQPVP